MDLDRHTTAPMHKIASNFPDLPSFWAITGTSKHPGTLTTYRKLNCTNSASENIQCLIKHHLAKANKYNGKVPSATKQQSDGSC